MPRTRTGNATRIQKRAWKVVVEQRLGGEKGTGQRSWSASSALRTCFESGQVSLSTDALGASRHSTGLYIAGLMIHAWVESNRLGRVTMAKSLSDVSCASMTRRLLFCLIM